MNTPNKTKACLAVGNDRSFIIMVEKVVYWEADGVLINQFEIEEKISRKGNGYEVNYILWVNGVSLAQAKRLVNFANGVVAGYREAKKNQ